MKRALEMVAELASRAGDDAKALAYYKCAAQQSSGLFVPPPFVPSRILVTQTVSSDIPGMGWSMRVTPGEHECESNKWGAVSVRASNGKLLGIKPSEFEVIEWVENPHIEQ